ncbi:MAG: glycosyltransferase family 2 protein [Nitrospirae bacterium]|nr:MAG: glycosyltransferase family 2 protein [Nitrospirota bacterium]
MQNNGSPPTSAKTDKTPLTILMPCLNEEKSIGKAIESIPVTELQNDGYEVEVLIVDGGSADDTVKIAKAKGAKVITSRAGYGIQHRTGFLHASGSIIVTADSDYSYPLEDSPRFLRAMKERQLDFITTNRFGKMEKDAMHPINKIGNKVLTLATNLLFGLSLKDSQSGMWFLRKDSLERLHLTSDGMSLSQEIKIEAFKKLQACEMDSRYRKRVGNTKLHRLIDGWKNLRHLFEKRLDLR